MSKRNDNKYRIPYICDFGWSTRSMTRSGALLWLGKPDKHWGFCYKSPKDVAKFNGRKISKQHFVKLVQWAQLQHKADNLVAALKQSEAKVLA